MNPVLARWNSLDVAAAANEVLPCCGSQAWALALASRRPYTDEASLTGASATIWLSLPEEAWREAFDSHPRIGQHNAQRHAAEQSLKWSVQEQSAALSEDESRKLALEAANRSYEEKFGRIFIVCASGKTSSAILTLLEARLQNDPVRELHEAVEQQRQITNLRLHRWLESE